MRSFYRRIGSVQVQSAFVRPLGGVHVPTTDKMNCLTPLLFPLKKKKNKIKIKKEEKKDRGDANIVLRFI